MPFTSAQLFDDLDFLLRAFPLHYIICVISTRLGQKKLFYVVDKCYMLRSLWTIVKLSHYRPGRALGVSGG